MTPKIRRQQGNASPDEGRGGAGPGDEKGGEGERAEMSEAPPTRATIERAELTVPARYREGEGSTGRAPNRTSLLDIRSMAPLLLFRRELGE